MRVLVVHATKMGSTAEIAQEIAHTLREKGILVDVSEASKAKMSDQYDGVVVGSDVTLARWRPEVVRFLEREMERLALRPVWLFHDGPAEELPDQALAPLPRDVRSVAELIGIEDSATFSDTRIAQPDDVFARMATAMPGTDSVAIHDWAANVADRVRAINHRQAIA